MFSEHFPNRLIIYYFANLTTFIKQNSMLFVCDVILIIIYLDVSVCLFVCDIVINFYLVNKL